MFPHSRHTLCANTRDHILLFRISLRESKLICRMSDRNRSDILFTAVTLILEPLQVSTLMNLPAASAVKFGQIQWQFSAGREKTDMWMRGDFNMRICSYFFSIFEYSIMDKSPFSYLKDKFVNL